MLLKRFTKFSAIAGLAILFAATFSTLFATGPASPAQAADQECQTFDTGYSVCGRFLDYWRKNGGLAQQGMPISQIFEEKNADPPSGDGQVHKVQYFQRARFEEHLENQPPYDVLLGLLGSEQFRTKYGVKDPNAQLLVIRGRRNESKIANFVAKPGYTFLVLDLLVTNTTPKKILISPASITVRTAEVYDYGVAEATYQLSKQLRLTELNLNETLGGELAFEVPVAETPKSLTINYFDNKVTVQL